MCFSKFLIGAALIFGAILVKITWLGICFGSVILGIVLLVFAPEILFVPFTIGTVAGLAFITSCEKK